MTAPIPIHKYLPPAADEMPALIPLEAVEEKRPQDLSHLYEVRPSNASDDDVPTPDRIDLTQGSDEDDPPFDARPLFVMLDDDERGEYWCHHCRVWFHYKRQLHQHLLSQRHAVMLRYLNGEPMYHCLDCNWLPDMPHLHLAGARHRRAIRFRFPDAREPDLYLRQVLIDGNGRRISVRVEGAPSL